MTDAHRSGCPINLTLEVLGDKWSLLVIRDIIFGDRRHFRELLTQSDEGIASNILADRLKRLVEQSILTKADNSTHKQKSIYSLTAKGIELLPVLIQMSNWGLKHQPVTKEMAVRARLLDQGGSKLLRDFMEELRTRHLGSAGRRHSRKRVSISARLNEAYEAAIANEKR